jgi:hypothetical protein
MAYDVRVIPIREFMKTNITGEIDLQASRDMLLRLMDSCKRENMTRILIDTREATNRVAILNRPKDDFDRAAFLELCAGNRGYHIRAFREFEDAFSWLVSEQPSSEATADSSI